MFDGDKNSIVNRIAIVLAAGQGTRMNSDLPKVMHRIDNKPLISYVLNTLHHVPLDRIYIVVGYRAEEVMRACEGEGLNFVLQKSQLGTGHAVLQCEKNLRDFEGTVMVLNGDVPGLRASTINSFIDSHERSSASATVLTAVLEDPTGYGRIVRGAGGELLKIVEEKDAESEAKGIKEINSGLFCFDKSSLFSSLREVNRLNAQNEYYLTDVISILCAKGKPVQAHCIKDPLEVSGVNTIDELQTVEKYIKGRSA